MLTFEADKHTDCDRESKPCQRGKERPKGVTCWSSGEKSPMKLVISGNPFRQILKHKPGFVSDSKLNATESPKLFASEKKSRDIIVLLLE
jgi:hypothetical protein